MGQAKILYRLPFNNQVYLFEEKEGDEVFVVAKFESFKNEPKRILGKSRAINGFEIASFFATIQLPLSENISSSSEVEYTKMVNSALENILADRFQKVVLAQTKFNIGDFNYEATFNNLSNKYSNAFVYCFFIDGKMMMGASPEQLLTLKNGVLKSEALGGTQNNELFSEKEHLEHQFIKTHIETILNTLSFKYLAKKTTTKSSGNLSHLFTAYEIEPKSFKFHEQLIEKLHPTPAIGGLPVKESLDFITKNETFDRAYYAGYLGLCSENNIQVFVNLRCAECYKNGVRQYAGAGINKGSNAKEEWDETNRKMQVFGNCLA